jgi:hypothetical protein
MATTSFLTDYRDDIRKVAELVDEARTLLGRLRQQQADVYKLEEMRSGLLRVYEWADSAWQTEQARRERIEAHLARLRGSTSTSPKMGQERRLRG